MARGVECSRCGANTPLPDDLRVRTFRCNYCQADLETAAYAGADAVAADALNAFVKDAVAGKAVGEAPRHREANELTRPAPCRRCGHMLAIPMDLYVNHIRCPGCSVEQPVDAYISQKERVEFDMQRQLAGNEAVKRLRREGVPCHACAATNPVPDDGSVQVICRYCGAAILLADHAPPDAIARSRLGQGIREMREEIERQQAESQRSARVVAVVVGVLIAGALVAGFASGVLH